MDAVDLDVLRSAAAWRKAGHAVLLVTVIRTWGSSPRPPGSMMALRDDGRVAGSISGGCIEDDLVAKVHEAGVSSLAPGGAPQRLRYGISADQAHRFGLPCGGTLELALEILAAHSQLEPLLKRLNARRPTRRRLDLTSGAATLSDAGHEDELIHDEQSLTTVLGPRYRMLVIGAGQLSAYLCDAAVGLGFEVTVCDPRLEYGVNWSREGISLTRAMPDDAVTEMRPDKRTAVLALTHDPKLDDLALMDALQTPAFYVGALGSRANNAKRRERLKQHFAMSDAELARLHGPAGLFIGSRTPPEIAISILAEIIATKNRVALPLQMSIQLHKDGISANCEA